MLHKGEDSTMRMRNIIATARCYQEGCGGTMEGRKGEYRYIESGLSSVVLKDILVFHCTKCNAIVPEIPAAGVLHRVIAMKLLCKKTLLTGSELRFLRKLCGYSVNEFAEIMGSNKTVVSRWENQNKHGDPTDRTVRLLVLAKLVRELTGQPEPILRNVTVAQLNSEVEAAIKLIETGRRDEQYEISPEEIARFGGTVPESEPELVSVQ
jgi:transcriptional regulator with XRE-family HTH domain